MKKLYIIFIILFFISCKLLSPDDTTPPEIKLTIAGDVTEISRGVTLYLDIEDDSKIDYVSVMIDDTTAITVESNFDTIRFDVTPFADENEHVLYVQVGDQSANIGESEKLDVVITEFPGWRIYEGIDFGMFNPVVIDGNGLIWIGSGWDWNGLYIFNPENNQWTHLTTDNSNLHSDSVTDIKVISGSRVWLANSTHVIQYDFQNKRWISSINLPENEGDTRETEAIPICIDNNYDLWVGTISNGLLYYTGMVLEKWYQYNEIPSSQIFDLVVTSENTIFAGTSWGGVFSIKNGASTEYDIFQGVSGDIQNLTIDSSNNIWASTLGCAKFFWDGNQWEELPLDGIYYVPFLIERNGLYYTQDVERGLIVGDGTDWFYFDETDSPFISANDNLRLSRKSLAEASNGDIWMVAGGKLMRYRPSLGGYP